MAGGNIDLVRSIYEPWERGDFSVVDWAHPDIEYSIVGGLEPGHWSGVRAMTERSREQLREFDHFRIEVDGCRELDAEQVLVLWQFRGRGKTSGLEPPGTGAYLFHVRDGKVIELAYHVDRERALADLGLEE
jgi:ketosteroid isomerase-like protein